MRFKFTKLLLTPWRCISIEFKKITLSNMLKFIIILLILITLVRSSEGADQPDPKGKRPLEEGSKSRRSTSDGQRNIHLTSKLSEPRGGTLKPDLAGSINFDMLITKIISIFPMKFAFLNTSASTFCFIELSPPGGRPG